MENPIHNHKLLNDRAKSSKLITEKKSSTISVNKTLKDLNIIENNRKIEAKSKEKQINKPNKIKTLISNEREKRNLDEEYLFKALDIDSNQYQTINTIENAKSGLNILTSKENDKIPVIKNNISLREKLMKDKFSENVNKKTITNSASTYYLTSATTNKKSKNDKSINTNKTEKNKIIKDDKEEIFPSIINNNMIIKNYMKTVNKFVNFDQLEEEIVNNKFNEKNIVFKNNY